MSTEIDFSPATHPLSVLLVGFQDQDNLGLRYLMAAARARGHRVDIVTFQSDPRELVERCLAETPDVIGLSLIFQYMTPRFGRVIAALREAGVTAHVTVGGHYPSFAYEAVLGGIPGLDSIVRFEGEATFVELLDRLGQGGKWRELEGLAFRDDDGAIRATPLRRQIMDLDLLPFPDRVSVDYENSDLPTASVLGSRGCPWSCEFCSIRPFYEAQPGKLRRLREPTEIVEEMRHLHWDRKVSIFLFQDDDFLATGNLARRWAGQIADGILASDIAGRIAFKISCRSDEVRADIMAPLVDSGLTHVYMGVESGDEEGLRDMNKMLSPERHLQAGDVLRELGLSFDFGFMLLDPHSDFRRVRSNVDFLERFVGDGWAVASFCRMLPYSGTPIERRLAAEGRLEGTPFEPDYKFLDPKLDLFYAWMLGTFHERNFTSRGLCHILRSLVFESRLQLGALRWMDASEQLWLQCQVASANSLALRVLRRGLDHIEDNPLEALRLDRGRLVDLRELETREERRLTDQIARFFLNPERQARRLEARSAAFRGDAVGPVGGFDKTWTLHEGDWESRGLGVREARA